jgi:hypothetical protein
MRDTSRRRFVSFACLVMLISAAGAAQRGRTTSAPPLPPLSMTCVHHPDVIESAPGTCPVCKLALVPIRLAPAWTCPVHPAVIEDDRGACPICRRTLVPVTISMTWSCAGSKEEFLEPGTCASGAPRTLKRGLRPHGDHNPRHGGQFFMAADNWHHVEGIHPLPRVFRLYLYDDYARPLSAERMKTVRARVVTRERFDPATRRTTELTFFPLRVAGGGAYLEARIDPSTLPAEMTAKVQFGRDAAEHRFDFTFPTLTQAPPVPAAAAPRTAAKPPAAAVPAPRPPAVAPVTEPVAPVQSGTADQIADAALAPVPIPDTVGGILEQIRSRNEQIGALIARGDFAAVWVPAFAARDLALALEPHLPHLDAARRATGAPALQRVVRLAWLLDAHGDTGNRQQLVAAHAAFSAAVDEVNATFAEMKH